MAVPKIISCRWGEIKCTVNGQLQTFQDCVITPTTVTYWDWNKDGTRHQPGITIKAIKSHFDNVDHIILSRGMNMQLYTMPETVTYLQDTNKQVYLLQTEIAVEIYNDLVAKGERVGGLFHSTC